MSHPATIARTRSRAQVLGNARRGGTIKFALEAVRRLRHCREVAVLLSARGDVILLPHWAPQYAEALKRARHLCGVYRMPVDADAAAPVSPRDLCDDMVERWRELRGVGRRNAATIARARGGALPTHSQHGASASAGRFGACA